MTQDFKNTKERGGGGGGNEKKREERQTEKEERGDTVKGKRLGEATHDGPCNTLLKGKR